MEVPKRWLLAKSRRLCYLCLQIHKDKIGCDRKNPCKKCKLSHSTWLHDDKRSKPKIEQPPAKADHASQEKKVSCTMVQISDAESSNQNKEKLMVNMVKYTDESNNTQVLLATAIIIAKDCFGREIALRALIDSGSQGSLITKDSAALLNLTEDLSTKTINGIGGTNMNRIRSMRVLICPRFESIYELEVKCYIMKTLTKTMPDEDLDKSSWNHIKGLRLADPNFHKRASIDILLGMDVIAEIMMQGLLKGEKGQPMAHETQLGWMISGNINVNFKYRVVKCYTATQEDSTEDLSKFWELEELNPKRVWTKDEQTCEELYKQGSVRDINGRFIVKIPFKTGAEGPEGLGDSKRQCVARFLQLEKKFLKNSELHDEYTRIMKEYIGLGHMTLVSDKTEVKKRYYIPHHAVFKPESLTTKTRVVFDASMKTSTGRSLNDCMWVGAKQQKDLAEHMIQWRVHKVVFKADITKMYRQIKINEADQEFHTILWRDKPDEEIREYQMATVTFGTAAAPFLATRTLKQIAIETQQEFPNASEIIRDNFYVDDLISGRESVKDGIQAKNEIIGALGTSGLSLVKWCSNSEEFLQSLPVEMTERSLQTFSENESTKALGLQWSPKTDKFSFKINWNIDNDKLTKRKLLSESSKLFDPLGWLAPVVIAVKILMQKTWLLSIGWDDEVTESIKNKWIQIRNESKELEKFNTDRWINYTNKSTISLHGFADASEDGYSAVVYARVENGTQVDVKLLISKTRVAPTRNKLTIPRLELCGAVLLANLMTFTRDALKLDNIGMTAWSDSMITLGWLKKSPTNWKTFVANRVSEINSSKIEDWRHVRSNDNPADCASRGLSPCELTNHPLWAHGPSWLKDNPNNWKTERIENHQLEAKSISINLTSVANNEMENIIQKHSSWFKLVRIVAYCLRIGIPKNQKEKYLSVDELRKAKRCLYKICQQDSFWQELNDLNHGRAVSTKSKLYSLMPFIDKDGLIRVGGRLQHSVISYDNKHPVILPHNHHITSLIVHQMHVDTLHGGPRLMMGVLQKKYWIIQSKRLSTNEYKRCVTCRRYRGEVRNQIMGNLPKERVTLERAFKHTGVDYTGEINIKSSKLRSARMQKGYISLFICLGTGAVHLELVSEQTRDAFLAAFNRFMARRGLCTTMHSDNGSNFTSAATALERDEKKWLHETNQELAELLAPKGVNWKFIPPGSPTFGGKWERNIRSMKEHLKKTLRTTTLTFEEYGTLLCQIEACLNSRPIGPLTEDVDNLNVLTPGHFLIGDALLAPPQPVMLDNTYNQVRRWNHIQLLQQHFWKRWHNEYLNQLQQRRKWQNEEPNLKENDMVLIKDEKLPPRNWLMGRITKVHPGSDSKVRVVTVKTQNGELTRNIRKICPLVESEEVNEVPINDINLTTDPPEPRRNPPRMAKTTNLIMIMAIFYFISLIGGGFAKPVEKVVLTEFKHLAGIYFEELGRASIVRTDWHMTIHVNLRNYMYELKLLTEFSTSLQRKCDESGLNQNDHHGDISSMLAEKLREIKKLNILLKQGDPLKKQKMKRAAPLNIVGWAGHELFGVMDESHAEHIEQQIALSHDNEDHLLKLIKNQTTILDATANLMKCTQNEINENYGKMNTMITEITNETDEIRVREQILGLAVLTFILSDRLEQTQRTMLDILTDVHHGQINSYWFTPQQFMEQLAIINNHLPSGNKLPENSQDDLQSLYKLMKAKARVTSKSILVDVSIPLVSIMEFQIFHIIPIPVIHKGDHITIIPETKYILMALKKENFYQMDEYEFHTCEKSKKSLICRLRHPMYKSQSDKSRCERDLLAQIDVLNQACKFEVTPTKDFWIPLHHRNTWIYGVHRKTTMNIFCKNEPSIMNLQGTGIIQFPPECEISIGEMTIVTESNKHSEGFFNVYLTLNLSHAVTTSEHQVKFKVLNLTLDHNSQLETIHSRLKEIDNQSQLKALHHMAHYGTTMIFSIIIIISAIMMWSRRNKIKRYFKQPNEHHESETNDQNMAEQLSTHAKETTIKQDVKPQCRARLKSSDDILRENLKIGISKF